MLRLEASHAIGALSVEAELAVEPGECLALAGPSGAGKTSLLRMIAGLLRPAEGRIECGGTTWFDAASGVDVPPERRRCGFVFQDYALIPHLSVWRNVAYGMRGPRSERRGQAEGLLADFGLAALAHRRPRSLSGGERQRVAVARALAAGPTTLLLDEPVAALDSTTRGAALRTLRRVLRDADVPAVLVTHDFSEAAMLADRVAVIDEGRIVQEGAPDDVAARPASAFVADFSGAVVLAGIARPLEDVTCVDLDGGGRVLSTVDATGRVVASVYPWEITLEPPGAIAEGSARNHLECEVVSLTTVGNRVRVALEAPQALTAEVTTGSVALLGLRPGARVLATWKAAATRLLPL